MTRRTKPHDPALAAERAETKRETARLHAQGATVTHDRTGRIVSAYRSNFANLLLQRGSITTNHHDAVARLVEQWATWKGMAGKEGQGVTVDNGSSQPHTRCLVTDRQLNAGKDVAWILAGIPQPHRRLLEAFMVATVEEDRAMHWRGVVEREAFIPHVRGHRSDPQLQAVVFMLDALVAMSQAPRERRAA